MQNEDVNQSGVFMAGGPWQFQETRHWDIQLLALVVVRPWYCYE